MNETMKTALQTYLEKRQGHGVSDEEVEAYVLGFNDALEALTSDEVYYGAVGGKPGVFSHVEEAAKFLKEGDFRVQ